MTRKTLHAISATQMQLVDALRPAIRKTKTKQSSEPGCESRYFHKYVLGLPDGPMGAGAIRGTEGHKRVETFLNTGRNYLDALELEGLHQGFIPQPGPGLLVEQPMHHTFDVPGPNTLWAFNPIMALDVPVIGYIDLINTRFLATEGVLELTDWKFKKSIRDYAARGEDLIDPEHEMGIQMIPYAAWVAANVHLFPGLRIVRLRHVTFQTKDAKLVQPAVAEADLQRIGVLWETVSRRIVPRIKNAFAAQSAAQVPKNTNNCFKYPPHGCPYKGPCLENLGRMANIATLISQPKESPMGMLNSIMNPSAAAAVPPPQQSVAAAAPPRIQIQDESTTPDLKAKDCASGSKYRLNGTPVTFLCNVGDQASFLPDGGAPFMVPGSTPVLPAMVAPPVTAAPVQAPATPSASTAPAATQPAASPAPVQAVATPTAAPAAPTLAQATATATAEEKPKKAKKAKPEGSTTEPIQTASDTRLYFGCSPLGVATKTLDAYMRVCESKVQDFFNLPAEKRIDLRASSSQELGFGKWKGFLAEVVDDVPLEPGYYVVMPGDERIDAVANALVGKLPAGSVTMGGR